ncbi:MAG TPA: ABC transporter substrate-binding protein [Thermoclostridium sp.]|nr:ABC transporter substrate-binding protein [Thermoclostridium sp.]
MKKYTKILLLLCIFTLITALSGCGTTQSQETELIVVLDWTPNTNHTGLYVALTEGYFKDAGLNVTIIQPEEGTAEQIVASNSAQFGVSYQESVTFARSEGIPIVSLAAVIQHNTSGFASLAEKDITSPKDFENKKYGGWGSPLEEKTLRYLMEKVGADPDKVQIVTTGDADFFQTTGTGEIDYGWIYEGWDLVAANLRGIELNYIDLGKEAEVFDYYTPVIIASEKMISEEKELVQSFMSAVEKGYKYCIEKPEEAAAILLENVPELDSELVIESQKFLAGKYQEDAQYWGMQKEEVWERYMTWLYENGFIENAIDVTKAFTNDFLNK